MLGELLTNESVKFDPRELSYEMIKKLNFYLEGLIKYGGSDLHIKAGKS